MRCLGSLAMGAFLATGGPAVAERGFIEMTRMTEAQRSALAHSGAVLAATIDDARDDLAERDYRRAERELRKASRLCRQLADASPSLRLRQSFAGALESLGLAAAQPEAQLNPIYRQLDSYENVVDATELRAQVDRARGELGDGQLEAAALDLREASEKIIYFEVDLPIQATGQLLAAAKEDFQRGDYETADQQLREIQANLRTLARVARTDIRDTEPAEGAVPAPGQ